MDSGTDTPPPLPPRRPHLSSPSSALPPPRPPRPPRPNYHPVYRPLSDNGEIRLLLLHPAPSLEAPIECSLRHAFLSSHPRFEAVSYTWGTKGSGGNILLDGYPFGINENAEAALRRLRLPVETRWLWMDAICLNQDDYVEKNIHVPLMGAVYEKADQVLAWLGEVKDGMLGTLLSTVKNRNRFTNEISFSMKTWIDTYKHRSHLIRRDNLLNFNDSYLVEEIRFGEVRELLTRPWFTRGWIIQEAVVAKKLLLVCGPEVFEWDILRVMVSALTDDFGLGDTYNVLRCPEEPAIRARFHLINDLRSAWIKSRDEIRLVTVLFGFRGLQTTDPRDHIYAFLGLLREAGGSLIIPEYRSSPSEIYTDVAQTIIDHTKSLDILSCVREWRGVGTEVQKVYAYSCYDQTKYHDLNCWLQRDNDKKLRQSWGLLPPGWERVAVEGVDSGKCYYYDHNTGLKQDFSPMMSLPPQKPRHPVEYRICPEGWSKTWDNLGRSIVWYDPNNTHRQQQEQEKQRVIESDQGAHDELLALPSWVPNWALKTHLDPDLLVSWLPGGKPRYCADGGLEAVYTFPDARTIGLEGAYFDHIDAVGAAWHPETPAASMLRRVGDVRESWVPLVTATPAVPDCPYRGLKRGREDAMLLTHLGDDARHTEEGESYLDMVRCWLNAEKKYYAGPDVTELANMRLWTAMSVVGKDVMQTVRTPVREYEGSMKDPYERCVERIHWATSHRAMFTTKTGYMGLAPWNAKAGDWICVLKGGKTPFLLRPRDDDDVSFSLVGEVFVQGIMNGGALGPETPMREFYIR
ncbi:uncharacterized protein DNG_05931 [Cephalotrichum gorgonifer]|uniref:Heterokaryon incompatibility domain-containing protein n=1 Tax=Cephalotrichum gorgonifer TaxID=2041049 RepID=A0AAE8N0Q3_9PEZI|nr:uncharacterized protein DNG_05931 [Cephalotrichum gorgonifer]